MGFFQISGKCFLHFYVFNAYMLLFLNIHIFFRINIVRKLAVFLKMSSIVFVYDTEKPCNF